MIKKITFSLILIICFIFQLHAQLKDTKDLPKLLEISNSGTEFYFSFIPAWESEGAKNDLKIYISSEVQTKVTVEVIGKGFNQTKYTVPNDIIEFTLTSDIGQPYRKTINEKPEKDSIWIGAGVHITADDPIICYGVTRYQYMSDGFLALPVNALGREYIVASFADPFSGNISQYLTSYTSITAAYDNTNVSFTMGGTDWSQTASGTLPGERTDWNLNEGDVLLIGGLGQQADLSGSKIVATNPVAVVSGNFCAYIPTNCGCCDVIEEMEIPTSLWGTEYHVTRIADRLKNSIIKIFAKESKTKIYRDYNQIGFIRNAGGTEGTGYIHMRADNGDPRPIVISGDKPIGVTQFNTGQLDDGIESDPFQMVLVPVEYYQKEIMFNTPGIRGGFGFEKNYINLCYEATQYGTIPEDLMFAPVVGGQFDWMSLVDMSPNPGQPFERLDGGKVYYSKQINLPGDGVYKIKGNKPFAAYAYGFSWCDSYGFPASLGDYRQTYLDYLPPVPEWEMDENGNVNVKKHFVIDKPDDSVIRSNIKSIIMDSEYSYNYRLYFNSYEPCVDSAVEWSLVAIDRKKDAHAVVTFSDCNGNDTTLAIYYDNIDDTTNHDFLPPIPYWEMDLWGNVNNNNIHYVVDKPDFPEIRSNLDTIYLYKDASFNYQLTYGQFTQCVDYQTDWKLNIIDSNKSAYADITFVDCAGNDTTIIIYYQHEEDTLPPVPDWVMDSLGNVNYDEIRYVEDMPDNIAVRSNLNSIDMNSSVSYNYRLIHGGFIPCVDYRTDWKLEVIDSDWDAYAEVIFDDCAGNDTTLYISYSSGVDRLPPDPEWEMDESGNVNIKTVAYVTDKPDDPSVRSNLDKIDLNDSLSFNYKLFYHSFIKCQDPQTDWSLIVIDSKNDANAVITFADCAWNDTTITIFYDNPISVYENSNEMISFYPNPASDQILLSGIHESLKQIKIIDILGNEIYSEKLLITNDQLLINTKDFPEGMYLIQLITGKEIMTKKFVVFH
ncbi:T9SS type A sorting domain-containing protein [Bacteroidota bacterium]